VSAPRLPSATLQILDASIRSGPKLDPRAQRRVGNLDDLDDWNVGGADPGAMRLPDDWRAAVAEVELKPLQVATFAHFLAQRPAG
jgi:hypothetical protein